MYEYYVTAWLCLAADRGVMVRLAQFVAGGRNLTCESPTGGW